MALALSGRTRVVTFVVEYAPTDTQSVRKKHAFWTALERVVTFVVEYAPTDTQSVGKKHAFWTALERVVKEVSGHEQLFVLKDATARWIYSHEAARQKPLLKCYCAPPTAIPTHLGSQQYHTTCETAWSLRSKPTGEEGKGTAAYQPTTTDK